jgi:hypothetical protein
MRRPPVSFVLTEVGPAHHLLSVVIHHVIADAWSMDIIWRKLFEHYQQVLAGERAPERPTSSIESARQRLAELRADGRMDALVAERVEQLRGAATEPELPTDLTRAPRSPIAARGTGSGSAIPPGWPRRHWPKPRTSPARRCCWRRSH